MFAVRATYHTTLQASPMQLVFGRDAILKIKHVAKWEHIQQRKQLLINHNNKRETWQAMVMVPKGKGEFRGIGLVEVIWKLLSLILHRRLAVIQLHEVLHGF